MPQAVHVFFRRSSVRKAARTSSAVASKQAAGLEENHWLCPVEDRRRIDSTREGMIEGFALGSYVLLVDYTARLFRAGKASLSGEMAEILDRLHTSAEQWRSAAQPPAAQDVPWAASSRPRGPGSARSARG